MHGRKYVTTLCFVGLATLALASCGSSKKSTTSSTATTPTAMLTQAELAKQGDAICKQRNKPKAPNVNLANPPASQLKAVGTYFTSNATSIRTKVGKIQALGPPKTDAAGFAKVVAGGNAVAVAQAAAGKAAMSGNLTAYKAAFASLNKVGPATKAAAKQFGFKVCAQGG